jgi:hypothetical protein
MYVFKSRIWIPDPGVRKAPDPGSGSATLLFEYTCWKDTDLDKHLDPEQIMTDPDPGGSGLKY